MNKITNSSFLVLLISFFVLTSCEKEDSNLSGSLNITLNPGQGLTTANLEGLKLGIVKLPDGTTEDDNLDSLTWTSEPVWLIDSCSNSGTVVFDDIASGLYLVQIDNDSLELETFSDEENSVFLYVDNDKKSSESITIIRKNIDNGSVATTASLGSISLDWGDATINPLFATTVRCYDQNNLLTKNILVTELSFQASAVSWSSDGCGYHIKINDLYRISGYHHYLRDEYYKIEIELINLLEGAETTISIYPKSESWTTYSVYSKNVSIGSKNVIFYADYYNNLGVDKLIIEMLYYYE